MAPSPSPVCHQPNLLHKVPGSYDEAHEADSLWHWLPPHLHFTNPDKPCHMLEHSPTIQSLLLFINAHNSDQKLFLSVDPVWKQMEVVVFLSPMLSTMNLRQWRRYLAFWRYHFGDNSLEHFSQDTINQSKTTEWDIDNDCLITMEELIFDDIAAKAIKRLDSEAQFASTPTMSELAVILDCPNLLNIPQPEYPSHHDANANTVQTFFPTGQDTSPTKIPDATVPPDDSTTITASDSLTNDGTRVAHPVLEASSARASPTGWSEDY